MPFVTVAPEALTVAASDIAGIGTSINAANAAAAVPTTEVLAAAADEVSTQIAALFSVHAEGYQQLSAQMATVYDKFVQALNTGANTYAAAEANAVQTLTNAVHLPTEKLLGHPLIGSGAAAPDNHVPNLVSRIQSSASVLQFQPTGASSGLAATRALLGPMTNAAAASAAVGAGSIGNDIKYLYGAIEPWVQYGVNLTAWAAGVGWIPVPYIDILAPQINFFYSLGEPIVQSALFNTIDVLGGTVTTSQALSNIQTATAGSVNQFINTEIAWALGFLPPFPPIGAAFPTPPG